MPLHHPVPSQMTWCMYHGVVCGLGVVCRLYRRIKSFIDNPNSGQHNILRHQNARNAIHFLPCCLTFTTCQKVKISSPVSSPLCTFRMSTVFVCHKHRNIKHQTSNIKHRTSYIIHHTSYIIHHIIHQTPNTPLYRKHAITNHSYIIPSLDPRFPNPLPF